MNFFDPGNLPATVNAMFGASLEGWEDFGVTGSLQLGIPHAPGTGTTMFTPELPPYAKHVLKQYDLEISIDKDKGRRVIATRDYEPGDVVLECFPELWTPPIDLFMNVHAPNKRLHTDTRCDYCLERIITQPKNRQRYTYCPECERRGYCSKLCFEMAETDDATEHQHECTMLSKLEEIAREIEMNTAQENHVLSEVSLAWKYWSKVLLHREDPSAQPERDPTKPHWEDIGYLTWPRPVLAPGGPEWVEADLNMPFRISLSYLALRSSNNDAERQQWEFLLRREDANETISRVLASELGRRHGQQVTTPVQYYNRDLLNIFAANNFAITTYDGTIVGSGVYTVGALINHSCDPNTIVDYDLPTKKQIFRAVKRIRKGDEIAHAYTDPLDHKAKRHEKMKLYLFTCKCPRCLVEEDYVPSAGPRASSRITGDYISNMVLERLTETNDLVEKLQFFTFILKYVNPIHPIYLYATPILAGGLERSKKPLNIFWARFAYCLFLYYRRVSARAYTSSFPGYLNTARIFGLKIGLELGCPRVAYPLIEEFAQGYGVYLGRGAIMTRCMKRLARYLKVTSKTHEEGVPLAWAVDAQDLVYGQLTEVMPDST